MPADAYMYIMYLKRHVCRLKIKKGRDWWCKCMHFSFVCRPMMPWGTHGTGCTSSPSSSLAPSSCSTWFWVSYQGKTDFNFLFLCLPFFVGLFVCIFFCMCFSKIFMSSAYSVVLRCRIQSINITQFQKRAKVQNHLIGNKSANK